MAMALDDLEPRLKPGIVKRVGELAEAAANRRDHAALSQLAAGHEATPADRTADLAPEAERPAGLDLDPVEAAQGAAQILDLAGVEQPVLLAARAGPERRADRGEDRGV